MSTTTKQNLTGLTVTPTGGTTLTLESWRQVAANNVVYVFGEDVASPYRDTITLIADPSVPAVSPKKGETNLSVSPVAVYHPGTARFAMRSYVQNVTDLQFYPMILETRFIGDEFHVTEAQIQAFVWKYIILLASNAALRLFSRRTVNVT